MPGDLSAAITFAIIALVLFVLSRLVTVPGLPPERARLIGRLSTGAAGLLAVVFIVAASTAQVGTRDIGVLTTFGKPSGALSNGLHWKAPWEKVTSLDAAIQTDSYTNTQKDCVTVRIAHQSTACSDVSIRWQIRESAADSLFKDYRQFEHIRDSLVTRDLRSALNDQFEAYDVLAIDDKGLSTSLPLSEVAKRVTTQMQQEIGDRINVLSVIIPVTHFDDATQSRLNALQAQIAQTRIAQQGEQTAKAQAEANKALAQSVSNDPNVLVSKCFDLLNEMVTKSQQIPVGFSCWPGGSGSNLLINPTAPAK